MRYIRVSIAPLFLLLLAISPALHAAVDSPKDFHGWAIEKVENLDRQWAETASGRTSGTPAVRGMVTGKPLISRSSAVSRSVRASSGTCGRSICRSPFGAGAIDGSRFTKRGVPEHLMLTTRHRNGPNRGTVKLTHPSQATRSSTARRRLPGNNYSKYRRSVITGRSGVWRKSPRMGTRISSSRTRRRSSSFTRGATRVRRSPRRGF